MIMLQNYTLSIKKSILMNTSFFQIKDQKRELCKFFQIKTESCVISMILLVYFLKHKIMMSGLKMKTRLIQQEKVIKKESVDLSDMPPLEGDEEEVKEGKELKTLTPNKLLTRLPILLAQIKSGNNSCKLKNGIRQILYFLYQHNKLTKNVYNNLIKSSWKNHEKKYDCDKRSQNFLF